MLDLTPDHRLATLEYLHMRLLFRLLTNFVRSNDYLTKRMYELCGEGFILTGWQRLLVICIVNLAEVYDAGGYELEQVLYRFKK